MITLISGSETVLIQKQKQKRIQDSGVLKENITTVDGSAKDFSLRGFVNQCNTVSLFCEKRFMILTQPSFLKASKKEDQKEEKKKEKKKSDSLSFWEDFINHPNPDCEVLILCDGFEPNKTKKEYKLLAQMEGKTVTLVHCDSPKPWEMQGVMEQELSKRNLTLTRSAKEELLLRINGSLSALTVALDNLSLYGEKQIDEQAVIHLCPFHSEVNVWKLGNQLIAGQCELALETYRDCLNHGNMTTQAILPMLAAQLRKKYLVLKCYEAGLSNKEIKEKTGALKPEKDLESCGRHDSSWFLNCLCQLSELDQGYKSGKIDAKTDLSFQMELFLLRNGKGRLS